MDTSLYKTAKVSRGFNYHYYYSPAVSGKPTLLFLHGFPSTLQDWARQIRFFQPKGYGVLAPDMLGAGGTSKPLDSKAFRMNSMAADVIELLDAEGLEKVVGIGHDWGCVILSRLSVLYQDRFHAFGWIGLWFMEPTITAPFDLVNTMKLVKQRLGYEGYAYWEFFASEGASAIIEKNIDSFIQLVYPKDPNTWLTYMVLRGKTSEWMESNMQPGWAEYMTTEEIDIIRQSILNGGIESGLNYYKSQIENNDWEDNLKIPEKNWKIQKPSFFAAAMADPICTPIIGKAKMKEFGTDVTTVEFNAGHWIAFEASDHLNEELHSWLLKLSLV